MKTVHIAFTGGGTGGHIFPILAVAEELRNIAANVGVSLRLYYIGPTRGPIDIDPLLFEEQGIRVCEISGGVRLFRFVLGFLQSLWHLYFVMPDILFSKGGYGAAPVLAAAVFYRIPFFIHDSDAIPGRTNLATARFARRIAVAFPEAAKFFPAEKTAVVGNPVRSIFFGPADRSGAASVLGLDPMKKTISMFGGSQGAKPLNDLVLDMLPELLKEYQVIHQCGAKNFGEVMREAQFVLGGLQREQDRASYKLYGFMSPQELVCAYDIADVVIARAGSGSIFEIAARGRASILIPFRYAANDHQRANAYAYAETGAALVVEEENLTPHILLAQIRKILQDDRLSARMSIAAKAFAKPYAARSIAEELLRSIGITVVSPA